MGRFRGEAVAWPQGGSFRHRGSRWRSSCSAAAASAGHRSSKRSGAANIFRREETGSWSHVGEITADAGDPLDHFGFDTAIAEDGTVVIGAIFDDDNGEDSGSVYVFDLPSCVCPADLDVDGDVGFGDLLALLAAWGNEGGPEDLDGSGTVDFDDLLILLAAWGPCE